MVYFKAALVSLPTTIYQTLTLTNSRVEQNLSYVILNYRNIGDAGKERFLLNRNFPGSVVSYLLRMLISA